MWLSKKITGKLEDDRTVWSVKTTLIFCESTDHSFNSFETRLSLTRQIIELASSVKSMFEPIWDRQHCLVFTTLTINECGVFVLTGHFI